jgi:hypothetical protein
MMLHVISTFVLLLIAAGVRFRKNTRLHLGLMMAAFVVDISLVAYIEYKRHAIHQATHSPGPLLAFHIVVSLAVVVMYLVQMQLGRRVLAGIHASKGLHIRLGITFCALRLINYGTSFMVGGTSQHEVAHLATVPVTVACNEIYFPADSIEGVLKPVFIAAGTAKPVQHNLGIIIANNNQGK